MLRCTCKLNIAAKSTEQRKRTWAAFKWLLQRFACALSGATRTADLLPCRPGGSSLQPACQTMFSACLCPHAFDDQPFWLACNEAQPAATGVTGNAAWSHVRHCGLHRHQPGAPWIGGAGQVLGCCQCCNSTKHVAAASDAVASRAVRPMAAKSTCWGGHAVKVVPTLSSSDQHGCDVHACVHRMSVEMPSTVLVNHVFRANVSPKTMAPTLSAASNKQGPEQRLTGASASA